MLRKSYFGQVWSGTNNGGRSLCFGSAYDLTNITPSGDIFITNYLQNEGENNISYYCNNKIIHYYKPSNNRICHLLDYIDINNIGSKLGYIESCKFPSGDSRSKDDNKSPYYYCLNVIEIISKKIVASFDNVLYYSFSPSGNKISFFKTFPGEKDSGKPLYFKNGLFVYSFDDKSLIIIDIEKYGITDLKWAEHDNNIYFTNNIDVVKCNIDKKECLKTEYNGIYFSPDGKYYCNAPVGDAGEFHIYKSSTNQIMTQWENIILQSSTSRNPALNLAFKFWSKNLNSVVFSVATQGKKNVVFNISSQNIIGSFSGNIIGTNPQGTLVAVHPASTDGRSPPDRNKIEIIDLTKLKN